MFKYLLLGFFLPLTVSAGSNFEDTLAKYENSDINNKCSVRYIEHASGAILIIESHVETRQGLRLNMQTKSFVHSDSSHLLTDTDYDGIQTALFTETEHKMLVHLTFESNENDLDKASFCELPKKAI